MQTKIRSELIKMTTIMLVLIALGIYAHEFVVSGIMAKAALNLSIFAIFGIAAALAFRHVFNLRNEVTALQALQIDYGARSRRPLDPYKLPAVVFQEPELLGQGYRLITEELGKQDTLQISNATAQMLLHDIDQRINDRKSTIIYFSGLMVFLGLLGAFMGLMKTVQSVGDLIGAMDVSGAGGTDSFGQLIEGMKGPLNGMSVGFSSSLFGLLTSMVLGALERCMTSAMKALRNEFEHWLSNVSALEATNSEAGPARDLDMTPVLSAMRESAAQICELRAIVASSIAREDDIQDKLVRMSDAVEKLGASVASVTDPRPLLEPISTCVTELASNQNAMVAQFTGLIGAADADRRAIAAAVDNLSRLAEIQAAAAPLAERAHTPGPFSPPSAPAQSTSLAAPAALVPATGWFNWLGRIRDDRRERALRRDIENIVTGQRRLASRVEQSVAAAIADIDRGRIADHIVLDRLTADSSRLSARLTVLMNRMQAADADTYRNVAGAGLMSDLHGARLELEVLRERLSATTEVQGEDVSSFNRPADAPQRARG